MVKKNAEKWGGKVRIIGVSIDDSKEAVADHCYKKGWMDVEHYHRHESDCSDVYGVRGVPHVMLVDAKGKIAFKGHPTSRKNLEADLDTLLKGEGITGEGTTASAQEVAKFDKTPEGFKELDLATISTEIEGLKPVMEGLNQDAEITKLTSSFKAAFCVLVLTMRYCPNTDSFLGKYENFRVLVGPKDKIW